MREMKDSRVEWIGNIPAHWKIIPVKYFISISNGSDPLTQSGDTMVYGSGSNSFKTCEEYKQGPAVLLGRKGTINIPQWIEGRYWNIDTAFDAKSKNKNINLKLFYYLSICFDYKMYSTQTALPSMTQTNYNNMRIPFATIEEQQKIVAYLDNKCMEIDALVSEIQQQIETLEQYKHSVITEAVTKGLDPDVEMKDSGIEWIGKIPKHWITHPLYYYFSERKNKNALGLETNLLSLSYGKIIKKDINSNGGLLPDSFNTYNIIEKDDIIIRPTDLQNDKRSLRTGITREHGIITSAYIAMKAIKPLNPEYFRYLLHTYDVMKVFYNMGNGVRQGLNFSEFSRLMVFEPTIEEQNIIVTYLKDKCDDIDLAISEKKQQIETIEEYKKSLIFEYVTGKKEVEVNV